MYIFLVQNRLKLRILDVSVKEKQFYKPNVYKNGASEDVIDWDDDDVSSVHSIIEKT